MMNKCSCIGCRYYGEYNDFKLEPTPICKRHHDLKTAIEAIENSDSCEFKINVIERLPITLKQVTESLKNLCDNIQTASNSMTLFVNEIKEENNNGENKIY